MKRTITHIEDPRQGRFLDMQGNLKMAIRLNAVHMQREKESLQSRKYNLQIVVPTRYSAVRPLLRPLLADRTICGIQKNEYTPPTNSIVMEGDIMTRTTTDKKMNMVIPGNRTSFQRAVRCMC